MHGFCPPVEYPQLPQLLSTRTRRRAHQAEPFQLRTRSPLPGRVSVPVSLGIWIWAGPTRHPSQTSAPLIYVSPCLIFLEGRPCTVSSSEVKLVKSSRRMGKEASICGHRTLKRNTIPHVRTLVQPRVCSLLSILRFFTGTRHSTLDTLSPPQHDCWV